MSHLQTILTEKPSQARVIAELFGLTHQDKLKTHYYSKKKNLCIVSAQGHFFELAGPEFYQPLLKKGWKISHLPIVPSSLDDFKVNLTPTYKERFADIKKRLEETSLLIVATDPDSEGELIGRDIIEHSGYKGVVQRVLCNSNEVSDFRAAFESPQDINLTASLAVEADTRRKLDWLIGMNGTMAATTSLKRKQLIAKKGVFNVGRVVSALSLIVYDHELKIKNFVPKTFYKIIATVNNGSDSYDVELALPDSITDESGKLLNKKVAEKLLNILPKTLKVDSIDSKVKTEGAPPPFSLSSLQVECGKLNLSPSKVLSVIQTLYDSPVSALTYPRTDCKYLPSSILDSLPKIMTHLNKIPAIAEADFDLEKKPKCFDDSKITAHHAIAPTKKPFEFKNHTDTSKAVYMIVATRFVQQFMERYKYEASEVIMSSGDFHFKGKGKKEIDLGWKALSQTKSKENRLPENINIGQVYDVVYSIKESVTKPPSRLKESQLVEIMDSPANYVRDERYFNAVKESCGIGTSATQGATIEKAVKNGLIIVSKAGVVSPGTLLNKYSSALTNFSVENSVLMQKKISDFSRSSITADDLYQHFSKQTKMVVDKCSKMGS